MFIFQKAFTYLSILFLSQFEIIFIVDWVSYAMLPKLTGNGGTIDYSAKTKSPIFFNFAIESPNRNLRGKKFPSRCLRYRRLSNS